MKIAVLLIALGINACVFSQEVMTNVPGRNSFSLNGKWNYIVDPYENGYFDYRYEPFDKNENPTGGYFLDRKPADKSELLEYNFDLMPTLTVPGDWNSQDDKLFYYEGTVWYRKMFEFTKKEASNRVFLCFGGANYETHVYLNGRKLGKHVGGFTP